MAERIGNLGYLGFAKQASPLTPVRTDKYVPFYSENFVTTANHVEANPAYGTRFEVFKVLQGQRSHSGGFVAMAEPNTIAYLCDMVLSKGATTGTNPYTHPYGLNNNTDPASYTVDVSMGNVVKRFWGFQGSSIAPEWNENEMRANISGSALGSFQGREIASVSGVGPYTVALKTDYDPQPTKGLLVGDLIRFFKADETTVDATVATIINDTSFTTSTNPTTAAGDFVHLRPATPDFTLLTPFLWAKTQFKFASTATAALTATHTPLEQGSGWEVLNGFEDEAGSKRSGSFDPASLVRTTGRYNFTDRRFFDTPEELRKFNSMERTAVVVRHFAGSNNEYELRVTMNSMVLNNPVPAIEAGSVIYSEQTLIPEYSLADGQGFDVKVINALATV